MGSINEKEQQSSAKRTSNNNKSISTIPTNSNNTAAKSTNYNKNYNDGYNYKKSWTPKFKTNNRWITLEILHGQADTIRKQYEIISDLIKKYDGKTHGSQSHILANNFTNNCILRSS